MQWPSGDDVANPDSGSVQDLQVDGLEIGVQMFGRGIDTATLKLVPCSEKPRMSRFAT